MSRPDAQVPQARGPCAGAVHSYHSRATGILASEGEAGEAAAGLSPDACDCPRCHSGCWAVAACSPTCRAPWRPRTGLTTRTRGRGRASTAEASGRQVDPLQGGAPGDGSGSLTTLPCSQRPHPRSRWQEETPDQEPRWAGGWMTPSPCESWLPSPPVLRLVVGGPDQGCPPLPSPASATDLETLQGPGCLCN